MQFAIDLARQNYLLRTNKAQDPKKSDNVPQPQVSYHVAPTKSEKVAAFFAGIAIAGVFSSVKYFNNRAFLNTFTRLSDLPSEEETQKAAQKIIDTEGLGAQGVKAFFVADNLEDNKKLSEIMEKDSFYKTKKTLLRGKQGFWDKVIRIYSDYKATTITRGDDGAYLFNEKCAVTSKKTAPFIFNELGAAKISNNPTLKFLMHISHSLPSAVVGVGLFALAHTPNQNKAENKKGSWEKFRDYVDKNIEGITMLAFVPQLVFKAWSSFEAEKSAKKHLPEANLKALKVLHRVGLVTALATAVAPSVGINIGNKVQNNIIRQNNSPKDVYDLLT